MYFLGRTKEDWAFKIGFFETHLITAKHQKHYLKFTTESSNRILGGIQKFDCGF